MTFQDIEASAFFGITPYTWKNFSKILVQQPGSVQETCRNGTEEPSLVDNVDGRRMVELDDLRSLLQP